MDNQPNDTDVPGILDAMLNAVQKHGPMVLEIGNCNHCHMEWWAFHPMSESVPCGNCGRRNASKVLMYRE